MKYYLKRAIPVLGHLEEKDWMELAGRIKPFIKEILPEEEAFSLKKPFASLEEGRLYMENYREMVYRLYNILKMYCQSVRICYNKGVETFWRQKTRREKAGRQLWQGKKIRELFVLRIIKAEAGSLLPVQI